MGSIFKIAAGVLIASLLYHIIMLAYHEPARRNVEKNMMDSIKPVKSTDLNEIYRNQLGTRALIDSYYLNNKTLPKYYSDLKCWSCDQDKYLKVFLKKQSVYFMNNSGGYYALKFSQPATGEKVKYTCAHNIEEWQGHVYAVNCNFTNEQAQAPNYKLSYPCDSTSTGARDLICQSDKLIKSEQKMEKVYFKMLGNATPGISALIKQRQKQFYRERLISCIDEKYMGSKERVSCIVKYNKERTISLY